MKILYGVQGTGNGHITRARAMAKALKEKNIDVQFLVSGRDKTKLFEMEPFGDYWWREGLTFRARKGRVVLSETVIQSRLVQLAQDIKELNVEQYDLVVTDYEPVTAWAGRMAGIKTLGLGHQYAFSQNIPQARGKLIDQLVLKNFAPADLELGLHWHHFGAPILPPIAPVHDCNGLKNRDFILVYLPFESKLDITRLLKKFPDTSFLIYHPEATEHRIKNLSWRKPSRCRFPVDLAVCKGVICNAGFELASEALQLGKKILVKPMAKQIEQYSNALALEQLGWGKSMAHLDPEIVDYWLSHASGVQVNYPDTANYVADYIAQDSKGDRQQLSDFLWAKTELPDDKGGDHRIAA